MEKYKYIEKDGELIAVQTKEWTEAQQTFYRENVYKKAGIPCSRFKFSFESYEEEQFEPILKSLTFLINNFERGLKSKANMYFWGGNSTKKSSLASVLGMKVCDLGFKVSFITFSDLIEALQNMQFDENERDTVLKIEESHLLIVDDAFDRDKTKIYKSNHQIPYIDTFFRKRLETSNTITLFTSNTPIEELENSFGLDIYHLIKRNVKEFHFKHAVDLMTIDNDFWEDE